MVRPIIFQDEITLWWEYAFTKEETRLDCFLNGAHYATIASTHVSFTDLQADTEYAVRIQGRNTVFEGVFRTKKAKNRLDVSKPPYNAVGDGKTLNTKAIQAALDDCTEKDYVYIPQGNFLSGGLRMHDDTELYLEKGSVLQGSIHADDYLPKIKSRFEGLEFMCYSSLLNAGDLDSAGGANCKNIVIRGGGRIVGGGNPLRAQVLERENARLSGYISSLGDRFQEFETKDTLAGRFRGRLVNVSNVDNFVVCGVSMENSPSWNLHMVYSTNLTVYNCAFISHDISNGDGIDPDSVENCAIFGCKFDTSDDCIAIKSGRNPEGNIVNRKSADIYIFDCVAAGHSICVGSEMSGGVENVYVWDCDMRDTIVGMQLKFSKKRGGYIKNVFVDRCLSSSITIWSPTYNNDGEAAPTQPEISNFSFRDCVLFGDQEFFCEYKYIRVVGIEEENPVSNVSFQNITLKGYEGEDNAVLLQYAKKVVFKNIIKD